MVREHDIELIESYLEGQLSPEERAAVEERLSVEPEFAAQFQILRDLPTALKADTEGFRKELQSVIESEKLEGGAKVRRLFSVQRIALAASLILGVTLAIYFFRGQGEVDLYQAYFEIPSENISVRNEALDQTLLSGLEAYRSADYQQAAGHFGQYSQQNPDDLAARFYEAMSLMGSEQYVEAERQLENLRANAGQYSTAVDWYLSLLYLRANDRALAISTLTELAKSSGFYADKATELLADLSGSGGGGNHLAD